MEQMRAKLTDWLPSVSPLDVRALRPYQADRRLQQLMDRNNEGLLTEQERADLAALTSAPNEDRFDSSGNSSNFDGGRPL